MRVNIKVYSPVPEPAASMIIEGPGEQQPPKGRFRIWLCLLACAVTAGVFFVGCRTPCLEESFSGPFDGDKVARLSHEAFSVAWDAKYWASRDLRFAAFKPTPLDWEVVAYLGDISGQVGWVGRKVNQNPSTPRVSSAPTYDVVAYDVMMLRLRYQPTSFTQSTGVKIEHLLRLIDEIAPYYSKNKNLETQKGRREKVGS